MSLFSDLREQGLWDGYDKYVLRFDPILRAMGERGIPISADAYAAAKAELEARLQAATLTMRALVPDEVRPFIPRDGYKKLPQDFAPDAEEFLHRLFPNEERRWVRLRPWTPSHAGLLRYMQHKGHPIPRDWKTGKNTTEEAELRRLVKRTRDPLYDAVLEYRDASIMLNSHISNWAPGLDGRVHPSFYSDTATGQLTAKRPNTMNAPHHKESQGKLFRSIVVARPGHTLLEFDYKSFHVQTLAFEARDADLLRVAKLDPHSFLTAHFLKLPEADRCLGWDDATLREWLACVKKAHAQTRNAKAKHALLGYNNGMGYRKLYNQYQEFFSSQAEAKRLMDALNALFPKAARWRDTICAQAHEQGYLLSRYGCIRYFPEVFRFAGYTASGAVRWEHGDDMEAAKSYLPQNDAHCYLKDAILPLEGQGLCDKYNLINSVHDALMFECPNQHVEEARSVVPTHMSAPSATLTDSEIAPTGLSVEVEGKWGQAWSAMQIA